MTKGIYAKILEIQKSVGAIEKAGTGPSQKGAFKYIRAEDVTDKVHSLLNEHGVITVPTIKYTDREVIRDGAKTFIFVAITVEYEYIDVEDGSSVIVTSVGEGSDIGSDTATRKAATQALKISHLQFLSIPNSEFDDEGAEPTGGAAAEKPQARAVAAATKATAAAGAADGDAALEPIRAKIKVAARKAGLDSTALNIKGKEIHDDFFNQKAALETLLKAIEKDIEKG